MPHSPSSSATTPDPRLERALRQLVAIGALLALVLLRVDSPWFGALPLWLLGMPLVSWWALHRFRLPRLSRATAGSPRRRRRAPAQARRRLPPPALRRIRAA
jgi:hypothetical protein